MVTSRFARVCLVVACLVVAPLFVLGLVVVPASLGIAAGAVTFVAFYRYAFEMMTAPRARRGAWVRVARRIRWVAAGVLVLGPTVAGLAVLIGPVGLLVAAVVVVLAVLAALVRRGRSPRPAPPVTGSPRRATAAYERLSPHSDGRRHPGDLTTDALCRAWRTSQNALRATADPRRRLRIVELRQGYLDELERRDPAGFARWLRDEAQAGGDPARHITAPTDPGRPGS